MEFSDFMNEYYPDLELKIPVFYNWDIGIRFELGIETDDDNSSEENRYFKEVYHRAITLFKSLHLPEDEIFLVANVHDFGNKATSKYKLNLFSRYTKDKSLLTKLTHITYPYVYPEDDKEGKYKTHRFILKCKVSDINYVPLLKAICNVDYEIKPYISHDVFFINLKTKTIFQIYDDRGCDLVAPSPESIKDMYEKYNGWIFDYDRTKIDQVFK